MSTIIPYRFRYLSGGCHIFKEYTIEDNQLWKGGNRLGTYDPTQHKELPGALAKLKGENTEALLQFVRTYGNLGYGNLEESCRKYRGEPLPWIRSHIQTIQLCLALQRYVNEQQKAWDIEDYLNKYRLRTGLQDTHTYEIPIAVKGGTDVMRLTRKQHESMHDFARKIRQEIIQRNIQALTYRQRCGDGTQRVLEFAALIEVIYWHLADMEHKPVKLCKECGALFIAQHGRQQYCPHPKPGKESLCSAKARQTRRRQTKRVSTP